MLFELLSKRYPGMRQWLSQRLSAVVLASYFLILVLLLVIKQPSDYVAWQAFFQPVWWRVYTFICFVCLLLHAWLGVSNVLKDYIFNTRLRMGIQILVEILVVLEFFWVIKILWQL